MYAEIYGNFTETYRIVIAYTEMDIDIIKQSHVFYGYKSLFVSLGHKYRIICNSIDLFLCFHSQVHHNHGDSLFDYIHATPVHCSTI